MKDITRLFDFPYYQLMEYNLDKAFVTKYKGEALLIDYLILFLSGREISAVGHALIVNNGRRRLV